MSKKKKLTTYYFRHSETVHHTALIAIPAASPEKALQISDCWAIGNKIKGVRVLEHDEDGDDYSARGPYLDAACTKEAQKS